MNCRTEMLLVLLSIGLTNTRRNIDTTTKQRTHPTSVQPLRYNRTTFASRFSVKRCSLLDFVVIYKNITSGFHMDKKEVEETFNATLQMFPNLARRQLPQCYKIQIEVYNVTFTQVQQSINVGEMRATLLFKVTNIVKESRLEKDVTQCISAFQIGTVVRNHIKQHTPNVVVDGVEHIPDSNELTGERICCGVTPGTFRTGNHLCACNTGYFIDPQSNTGCSKCPGNYYGSERKGTFNGTAATRKKGCYGAPEIINSPKSKRVKEGSSVTLTCGVQAPHGLALTIKWFKDEIPIPKANGNSFRIASFKAEDQGSYKCEVLTDYGSEMSAPALIVLSDVLTTLMSLSIQLKRKNPAPTSEKIVDAVKTYLNSNEKGWRFGVEFKEIISKTPTTLRVKLYLYSSVNASAFVSYYKDLRSWVVYGVTNQKLKPLKVIRKTVKIESAEYCLPEENGKFRIKGIFNWPLLSIGNVTQITCPYGPNGAHAQIQCLGEFSTGAFWSVANDTRCQFQSKRTQAFAELMKRKIDKQSARKMAKETKSITRSGPAVEINSADVAFVANIIERILNTGEVDSTGQDLVDIIDIVLSANSSVLEESQRENKTSNKYVEIIETIAAKLPIPPGNRSRDLLSSNIFIKAVLPNMDTFAKKGYSLSSSRDVKAMMVVTEEQPSIQTQTEIHLPPSIVSRLQNKASNSFRLSFSVYQNHKLFQFVDESEAFASETAPRKWFVNTRVISCSVVGAMMSNLTEPVVTTFEPLKERDGFPVCAFWNFSANGGNGNWSTAGCKLAKSSYGKITCHCNHMTNFAVLFSAEGPQSHTLSDPQSQALSIISYIGCAVSLIGVLLTLITYTIFGSLRKSHAQHILMSLCVALALLLIVFLAGATRVGGMTGCRAAAVLLHYLVLAVVLWMGVEGYQMYLAFVKVLATYQKNFMIKISILAWGVPVVIVIITAAIDISFYGNKNHCVLTGVPFYAAMFAPTLLVITGNFVIFFYVMWCLVRLSQNTIAADKKSDLWFRCRTALAVMVLLGLTWIFGALAVGNAKIVFEYLFCIFNAFQGLFIFVFYCARQPEVRKQWKSVCRSKEERGISTKSNTPSNTFGISNKENLNEIKLKV